MRTPKDIEVYKGFKAMLFAKKDIMFVFHGLGVDAVCLQLKDIKKLHAYLGRVIEYLENKK